jgi:integrase
MLHKRTGAYEVEFVQPIRDKKKLESMRKILGASSKRDELLFTLGINSALRISDLLKLTIGDVVNDKGKPQEYIDVKETKTSKAKRFPLTPKVVKAVNAYLLERPNAELREPLFRSKKGGAITRQHAWLVINKAAEAVGITDKIGTHTLRKTWAYHAYKAGTDITLLQQALNHAAPSITLRYIGITQDDINNVYLSLDL